MEINLSNLEHNYGALCSLMPQGCKMMAVVKADAYGHGAVRIAKHLNGIGVKSFAVSSIEEGIELRKNGVIGEVLILGWTSPKLASELKGFSLTQAIIDYTYAIELNRTGIRIDVQAAIDTGMHRIGIPYDKIDKIISIFNLDNLNITGIYTHLCSVKSLSEEAAVFTKMQTDRFDSVIDSLKEAGIPTTAAHAQSSYGLLNYPEIRYDYVRIGDALYGMADNNFYRAGDIVLKPVMSLKSRVIHIGKIKKGETIGYGNSFTALRDSEIAVLSIGFADGISRSISREAYVLINGYRAKAVGSVCMDLMFADITDIGHVKAGDEAVLIGEDIDEKISTVEFAGFSGTIPGEAISRLNTRIKRLYK